MRILFLILAVDLALLAGTALNTQLFSAEGAWESAGRWKWPLAQLSLIREGNFGAWWSAALLAAGGALFAYRTVIALVRAEAWLRVAAWATTAALLIGLSFDEVGSIHESLLEENAAGAKDALSGPGPWLLPFAPMAILAILAVRRLRGAEVTVSAWIGWVGALCLSTIGAMEQIEALFALDNRPMLLGLIEEGTELLGASLILFAGLLIAGRLSQADRRAAMDFMRRHRTTLGLTATLCLALATVFADAYFGRFAEGPQSGLPQWWTGSVAAAWLATSGLAVQSWAGATRIRLAGTAVAVGAALLSLAYGSNAFGWAWAIAGRELAELALRTLLAILIVLPGLIVALRAGIASAMTVLLAGTLLVLGEGAPRWFEVGALALAGTAILEAAGNMTARKPSSRSTRGPRRGRTSSSDKAPVIALPSSSS